MFAVEDKIFQILYYIVITKYSYFIITTVFPLISAPGAYQILELLGAVLIRGRH